MKKLLFYIMLSGMIINTYSDKLLAEEINKTSKSQKQIKLYIYTYCPYCTKVKNFLTQHGIINQVTIIDAEKDATAELKKLSGKDICPFLFNENTGEKISDSSRIIDYLKKLFNV